MEKVSLNGDSRFSEALKGGPAVLEYIISLNPHDFERLRNPLLNKVMPPRISLKRIAAMVGIPLLDFLARVNDLSGLPAPDAASVGKEVVPASSASAPDWMSRIDDSQIRWVDVTPIDAELGDPMPPINIAVNTSKPEEVVGVKHMWEPQPLYDIWHARGFKFWSKQINHDLWHIYIYKP